MPKLRFLLLLLVMATIPTGVFAQTAPPLAAKEVSYQQVKNEWTEVQKRLQEARRKNQDTTGLQAEGLEKAKKMAVKSLDQPIKKLEKIIARVNKMGSLSSGRKEALVADLTGQIAVLRAAETSIEAATNKDELIAVVQGAKSQVSTTREIVQKIVGEIRASHIDATIKKLDTIIGKIESHISALKGKGKNVSEFELKLKEAKDKINQASARNNAKDYKEARKIIEEARVILVKLLAGLKSAGVNLGGENE